MVKLSKEFEKKYKIKRVFAKITRDGKWHVAVEEKFIVFFPCQHYGWFGGQNEVALGRTFGIERGPFNGFIFTKPHKICGTCMKMKNNRKFLKEAGFK